MAEPSPANEPAGALTRNALIPLSIVTCFVLVYVVHAPPWTVIPIGIVVMLLYLGAPVLGRRSLARFDRDLVQLLASGKRTALSGRFNGAIAMRLLAPPALVAERKGLVASELGHFETARDAYREALDAHGADKAPLAVRLGYAHASYALGEDADAIAQYRAVLSESGGLPRVARNLAHALARSGTDLGEAEQLLEDLSRVEPARADLRMIRALVHAQRGQSGPARKILDEIEGEHALRAEVEHALEAPPKKKKARTSRPNRDSAH